MKELIEENKKSLIVIALLIGLLLIFFLVNLIINKDDNQKQILGENYVYTLESEKSEEENIESELPQINLKGDNIDIINEELMDDYSEVVSDSRNTFNYGFDVNKNILSLLIRTKKYEYENYRETKILTYKSYNIDINSKEELEDEDLFLKFNITEDEINNIINNKLNEYYNRDLEDKIIEKKDCNLDCWLEIRKFDDLETQYTIEKNKLIAYIKLEIGSDNDNFSEDDFRIEIK